jgi:hypothetical protein
VLLQTERLDMRKIFIVSIVALLSACASKPPMGTPEYAQYEMEKSKEERVKTIDQTLKEAPDWYKEKIAMPGYFASAGTDVSSDMQFALDKAMMAAKISIASQIGSYISSTLKLYINESGETTDATVRTEVERAAKEMVSEVKLHDFEIEKHQIIRDGQQYRAYVLLKMPKGVVNNTVVSQAKKNKTLAPRVEKSSAFQELEKELEKFRAQKN